MMPIKKILCPTDLSAVSYRGIDSAVEMALQYSAKLFLLHIVNGMPIREDRAVYKGKRPSAVSNYDRRLLDNARQKLQSLAARKVPEKINLGLRISMGAPAEEIRQTARDEYVDVIIISTRGHSGWRRLVAGSLTQWLVAHVDCPVISIPCKKSYRHGTFTFKKYYSDKKYRNLLLVFSWASSSCCILFLYHLFDKSCDHSSYSRSCNCLSFNSFSCTAAKKNEELIELIDDSAKRIIQTVLKFTRRKDPMKYDKSLIACKEHVELAREAAEKSMVLLKNKNKILPLNVDKIRTLAIIGRLADLKNTGDRGSSYVRQKNIITPLQGIKNLIGDKIEVKYDDTSNIENAIEIASSSDVVITIVGYTHEDEGEYIKIIKEIGGDRDILNLKEKDVNLINSIAKVNQNCIVVLIGGSAIIMEEWKDNVVAILMAWYSGMQGGNALANILFGIVNPSGKLPFTIPKDSSHLPFFKKDIDEITYDYFHGYTLLEKENIEPAFAFGFGLSYTSFKIENLRVHISGEVITSTVDVSNTGNKFGEEVVQLYIGLENSKIKRPKKLLKGFRKVKLNPGETKSVSIQINKMDLAWYNPKLKSWEVEPMTYNIYMGSSSRKEDLLTTSISIT